jgi:Tol biopolymer transport system component
MARQSDLLQSSERSVSNPRLSPDRRWIAFDAARPGAQSSVFVSPFEQQPIAESAWIVATSPTASCACS